MAKCFHKLTIVLLMAAILTGSICSPAVCHAHAGGEGSLSHGSNAIGHDEPAVHTHGDGVVHSNRHHRENGHTEAYLESLHTAHFHISFLGIEWSFPQHDDSPGPLTKQVSQQLGVTRVLTELTADPRVDLSDLVPLRSATAECRAAVDSDLSHAASLKARAYEQDLLCERTHPERSGVLLI